MPPKHANSAKDKDGEEASVTEQLINKVCEKFISHLEKKFNEKFSKLEDKLNEGCNSVNSINTLVNSNQNDIKSLKSKVRFLEQQSKRNSLRFYGIQTEPNCSIPLTVVSFINNNMKVPCTMSDIDCAYSIGTDPEKKQSIFVKFVSNIKRSEVYAAKKICKNTGVVIFEDLTSEYYKLLVAAKQKYGKSNAWSSGGRVFVLRGKNKCIVNSFDDL